MAYAQWVIIRIINRFQNGRISVKNARVEWGKFHRNGSKDSDITPAQVNGVTVAAGETTDVSSCGMSDAASGTEGYLDLYDGDTKICLIYWSCPWGSKTNTFTVADQNTAYSISVGGPKFNPHGPGALGEAEMEISKQSGQRRPFTKEEVRSLFGR